MCSPGSMQLMLGVVKGPVGIEPLESLTEVYHDDIVTYEELMRTFRLRRYQPAPLG